MCPGCFLPRWLQPLAAAGGGVVVVVVVVSEDSLGYGSLPSMLFETGFLVHNVRQAS